MIIFPIILKGNISMTGAISKGIFVRPTDIVIQ